MKKGIYLYPTNKRLTITEKDGILTAETDYYEDGDWCKDTTRDNRAEQGEKEGAQVDATDANLS